MSNELATTESAGISSVALLMDMASMERLERIADIMASGKTTVPTHLRGSKGDCFAVAMQSMQWNMNPFAVAQKTHLVNGILGYEGQLVAAVINNSKVVTDRFKFEWFGPWEKVIGKFTIKRGEKGEYRVPGWTMADEEGCGIRVSATLKGERAPRVLELLLAQARVRNSTQWADDPKQQLAYLAQKKWARLYAPDVILGVYSPDEFEPPTEIHMGPAEVVAPAQESRPDLEPYPADRFAKNLPAWRNLVEAGSKTTDDILAMVQSKATLSAEQIKAIRDLGITDVPDPKTGEVAPPAFPADPEVDQFIKDME
jgi:hypothetical protein